MNRFSASDAALEGFRLTRERPGTVLAWAGINAIALMIMGAVMMLSMQGPFLEFLKDGGLEQRDPEALAEVLLKSWPGFLLVLVLVVAFLSILTGGIYRLVLRPEERGLAHLRLGADELRLTAVNLLLFAIGVICLTTVQLVGQLVTAAAGPATGLLASLVVAVPVIWVGVRLSLATPMTFAERRIAIGASWELTRGRVWPLLGMIVLALIFYFMVWLLITFIFFAIVQLAGGPVNLANLGDLGPGAIVVGILTLLIQLIMPVIQWIMIYSPLAVAYQQIHGDASPRRA
jgi:hypothetical protein